MTAGRANGARPCLGYDGSSHTTNNAKEGGHEARKISSQRGHVEFNGQCHGRCGDERCICASTRAAREDVRRHLSHSKASRGPRRYSSGNVTHRYAPRYTLTTTKRRPAAHALNCASTAQGSGAADRSSDSDSEADAGAAVRPYTASKRASNAFSAARLLGRRVEWTIGLLLHGGRITGQHSWHRDGCGRGNTDLFDKQVGYPAHQCARLISHGAPHHLHQAGGWPGGPRVLASRLRRKPDQTPGSGRQRCTRDPWRAPRGRWDQTRQASSAVVACKANSGQISCQSSGRRSRRVTAPFVNTSMRGQCSTGTRRPCAIHCHTAALVTPSAKPRAFWEPTISAAFSIGCFMTQRLAFLARTGKHN